MNILALNSSARAGRESKTEILLTALVEGMREAGADVEVINLKDKKINVCAGCFTCWTKTPGRCIHQDDMSRELFPKWVEADLCVYATPLFHHTVNATMKTFIERTLPVVEPYLAESGGRWTHPLRHQPPGAVVLSVAGFPALSAFEALSHYVRFLYGAREGALWAEIYRPGAEALVRAGVRRRDILEATRQAGRELVRDRSVAPETLDRIQQPIDDDLAAFMEMANCFWRSCISEGVTPREFDQKGLIPRPDSVNTFMLLLTYGFNPEGAGDARAVIQFDLSGSIEGACHFSIADGAIQALAEAADRPDLTIRTPSDLWLDIMTGRADGAEAFTQGRYTAEGDINLLINFARFFGPTD
ncbi:MAG: NAD(P)H-dependent oxidoreductase [Proteobacteria bacterium]|nr:NAD(P)H-dependent oxidoreductase [Pseudomonadota bacterium]